MQLQLMRNSRLHRSRLAIAMAAVLTLLSMFLYPGGTVLQSSSDRYSISHNFFSDLGMTVSYSQGPNLPGAVLFTAALLTLLGSVFLLLLEVVRLCSGSVRARRFAR